MNIEMNNVVTDYTSKNYSVGAQFTNSNLETCTIIGKLPGSKSAKRATRYVVDFGDNQITRVRVQELRKGEFLNVYSPSVYGVGYMGLGDFVSSVDGVKTLEYSTWKDMMKRCYGKDQGSYAAVTVTKEWHNFQNFAQWHRDNYVDGYHLDKDLKDYDARIYSPETCVFIPAWLNAYIVNRVVKSKSGEKGVILTPANKFQVYVADFRSADRHGVYLGTFDNIKEAKAAYSETRAQINFFARQRAFDEGLPIEIIMKINKQ